MAASKTSLSAGEIVRQLLSRHPDIKVRHIFPVHQAEAQLPYIVYYRTSMVQNPVKAPGPGADTVQMEVLCYAESYSGSVAIAEAVRRVLEDRSVAVEAMRETGLTMRSCRLTDGDETYADDAYIQRLVFTIRI